MTTKTDQPTQTADAKADAGTTPRRRRPETGDATASARPSGGRGGRARSEPGPHPAGARGLGRLRLLAAACWRSAVLLIAIDANRSNDLVHFILDAADAVDLGFFDRTDPIKDFDRGGRTPDVKNALFNYGLGAIVWLVIGQVADRSSVPDLRTARGSTSDTARDVICTVVAHGM